MGLLLSRCSGPRPPTPPPLSSSRGVPTTTLPSSTSSVTETTSNNIQVAISARLVSQGLCNHDAHRYASLLIQAGVNSMFKFASLKRIDLDRIVHSESHKDMIIKAAAVETKAIDHGMLSYSSSSSEESGVQDLFTDLDSSTSIDVNKSSQPFAEDQQQHWTFPTSTATTMLFAGSSDDAMQLWLTQSSLPGGLILDIKSGTMLGKFGDDDVIITSLAVSRTSQIVATCGVNYILTLWLSSITPPFSIRSMTRSMMEQGLISCMSFSVDDTLLACGMESGMIFVVETGTVMMPIRFSIKAYNAPLRTLHFTSHNRFICTSLPSSSSSSCHVRLYDVNVATSGTDIKSRVGGIGAIVTLDANTIVIGGFWISVMDITQISAPRCVKKVACGAFTVTNMSATKDATMLAVATSQDITLRIFSLPTLTILKQFLPMSGKYALLSSTASPLVCFHPIRDMLALYDGATIACRWAGA